MTDSADFPRSPSDITDSWLTQVLRSKEVLGEGTVSAHVVEPIGEHGAAGLTVRVRLLYDGAETSGPSTLVAKFVSNHDSWRELAAASGLYRREVLFYETLSPRCGDLVPLCSFSRFDRPTGEFALLLEDMVPSRVGSLASARVADVEQAVEGIAEIHARFWGETSSIRWLFGEDRPGVAGARQSMIRQALPIFLDRDPGFSESSTVRLARMLAGDFRPAAELLSVGPSTVVHGDFHLQNVFLPGEDGGRLAIFDWQTAAKASGPIDIARLLGTSLSPAQRRAQEDRLLALYLDRLRSLGVPDYGPEHCRRDYLAGFVLSAFSNVLTGARMDPEQRSDFEASSGIDVETFFGRTDAAIADHHVERLLAPS